MQSGGVSWQRKLARDGLSIVGALMVSWFLIAQPFIFGLDTSSYWLVDAADPYKPQVDATAIGVYRYSPAGAQLLELVNWLPWPVFSLLWLALLLVTLAWLGRWWTLALLAFPPVVYSLYLGNIDILLGAAMVAGLRWPGVWAFVLLTKVTPGVGLLWFVVRREWRNLAIALGVTAGIAAVSFAIAPDLWLRWPATLATVEDGVFQPIPLWLRLLGGALLVVWGTRTNRPWTVVVAGALAIPWLSMRSVAMLVGVAPLLGKRQYRNVRTTRLTEQRAEEVDAPANEHLVALREANSR